MSLLVAWGLFPLVLILVSLGQGLFIDWLSGGRLPGVLLIPMGAAGIVTTSQLTTYWDWSAELTTPLTVVLAVGGLALGLRRIRRLKLDPWPTAAAVGVFAVFAAPVVLSGQATFAGYTVLGDTSIHFIGADHLLEHGRNVEDLAPSSYEMSVYQHFRGAGYPSGGPTALGAVRPLVAEDVAWVFQPFLAFLIATMALALYALLEGLVRSKPLRALITFVAAQPALVLAYALQGSIKEVGTAWAVALLAALLPVFASQRTGGPRRSIPLAVAGAAGFGVVGLAAAVWVGPVALAALVLSVKRYRDTLLATIAEAAVFVGVLAVLAFQSIAQWTAYLDVAQATVTAQQEFGNLLGPLRKSQMFGIWLVGDYRTVPSGRNEHLTYGLIAISAFSVVLGLIWALRKRAWAPLFFIGISFLGWAYVTSRGSPWADGKALMIVSPAVLLAAMLGPAGLFEVGRRIEAAALFVALTFGVLASNALAYHDVSLAPRDRLDELERIGKRISGEGPSLYTEFEEFGKHFLRNSDPAGSSEGWQRRLFPVRDGQYARMGLSYNLDDFPLAYVRYYRTVVLRRSPTDSRPLAPYERIYSGRFYDVWQRQPGSQHSVVQHLSIGHLLDRGGVPRCADVEALGQHARSASGRLAYSIAPQSYTIIPARTAYPPRWFVDPTEAYVLRPRGPGKIEDSVVVQTPGTYELWIMGSFGRGYEVFVDGRRVGFARDHLSGRDQYAHVGSINLGRGRHVVTLLRGGGSLEPGDGVLELLGPIVLERRVSEPYAVHYVRPDNAASLCRRRLDWIEVVRP
jgi:hypothetical protein